MDRPEVTGVHTPAPPMRRTLHVAFMSLFAVIGWGALLVASYVDDFGPGIRPFEGVLAFAGFFFVIVVARRMAM